MPWGLNTETGNKIVEHFVLVVPYPKLVSKTTIDLSVLS